MHRKTNAARILLAAAFITSLGFTPWNAAAGATTVTVDPNLDRLSDVLQRIAPGDEVRLLPGIHKGPLTLSRPVTIDGGKGDAVILGNGKGSVITVNAPNVIIRNTHVRGSGLLLETQDSGVFLGKKAIKARIEDNLIEDNLIGVYVWGAVDAIVKNNKIIGRKDLRMNERGNGVQIWNAPGAVIDRNNIRFGRDGIFVTTSTNNTFRNNTFQDLRFAVHYMYTNNSLIEGNTSKGNHIGYAVMYSTNIKVIGNTSIGDRDRGILFNFANKTIIRDNRVQGGPEKCVFIYNSNKNQFVQNYFSACNIGIHFTAGSERNVIFGNAFVSNRTQVKYVGTRWLDWSHKGLGNYWSDNPAFDLNGDGISDTAYRPNDLTDQILWRYPAAKLLTNSPAVQILKWAQSAFPALYPGGVRDTAPLMKIPEQFQNLAEPSS